ncbi:hypothetical protein C8R43DRAFT_943683 [Mycena crocata]|nr:hypothetical protein C8R43DRAFT_943683 [Mycena crocata]
MLSALLLSGSLVPVLLLFLFCFQAALGSTQQYPQSRKCSPIPESAFASSAPRTSVAPTFATFIVLQEVLDPNRSSKFRCKTPLPPTLNHKLRKFSKTPKKYCDVKRRFARRLAS